MGKILKILICLILLSQTFSVFAITLLTENEALDTVFNRLEHDKVINERKIIPADKVNRIAQRLGGSLVHDQGGDTSNIASQREFTFYSAIKNNQPIAIAVIIDEPGKWGPIRFIVSFSPQGKIQNMAVMSYTEVRGRPIARRSFLKQFNNKSADDPLEVNNDIIGVSGATVSSQAAAFSAKKALILYQELF